MPRNKSGEFGKTPHYPSRMGQNLPTTSKKPIDNPRTSAINYGAKVLGLQAGPDKSQNSLQTFLQGWVSSGTTSISEAYIYWALTKILGPEGSDWAYQQSVLGGRHGPGGAVVDFVVYYRAIALGIRVQTYRYHIAAGPAKQAYDNDQILSISTLNIRVYDIYEQDFIFDDSGQAAIKVCLDVLNGNYAENPITAGTAIGVG